MASDMKKAAREKSSARTHNGLVEAAPMAGSDTNGERPSIDQIRLRAYELYLERGAQPNDDLADWLRAERELRAGPAGEASDARAS